MDFLLPGTIIYLFMEISKMQESFHILQNKKVIKSSVFIISIVIQRTN